MQHASITNDDTPVSEMEIVSTFTKLIFGDEILSERESSIIAALRVVDVNVLRDDLSEVGGYLRNLGVREMIQLVTRVHRHMAEASESPPPSGARKSRAATADRNNPTRRPR